MPAPPLVIEPGWTAIQPFPELPAARSFVSGDPSGDRLRVAYFRAEGDERLLARAWFGPGAEGPPGHAHGGSVAAVLDEAMGACCWMLGHPVVAARLTVNFVEAVPLGLDARVEAAVERVDGRKVHTRASLSGAGGETLATATGLFVVLTGAQLRALGTRPR